MVRLILGSLKIFSLNEFLGITKRYTALAATTKLLVLFSIHTRVPLGSGKATFSVPSIES
jgi:hypothetical protein